MTRAYPWVMLAVASAIVVILAGLLAVDVPQTLETTYGDRELVFSVDRRFVAFPEDCVFADWSVNRISTIDVNNRATIGETTEIVCIKGRQAVYWNITFDDGVERVYALPVTILSQNLLALLALGVAAILGFVGTLTLIVRHVPRFIQSLNQRGITQAVAVIVFGTVMALGVLEVGFRVWLQTVGTEDQRIRYLYNADQVDEATQLYTGLPYLNFGLNPQSEGINPRGLRGRMVDIPKPDGTYRIVAVGGSTTYGFDVDADTAYPAQLEAILRFDYGFDQVEVVNLGIPAFNSLDSVVQVAGRALDYGPDLIIVYHGVNDAVVRINASPECYNGDTPIRGMGWDIGIWQYSREDLPRSAIYRLVALRFGWMDNPGALLDRLERTQLCEENSSLDLETQIQTNTAIYFERNLRSIIGITAAHDVEIMLATFDWNDEGILNAIGPPGTSRSQVSEVLKQVMNEQNAIIRAFENEFDHVHVFPFDELMPSGAEYWLDDGYHPTAAGVSIQAQLFAGFIFEQELISVD
jgi:lysophospholipase L1-like esterase